MYLLESEPLLLHNIADPKQIASQSVSGTFADELLVASIASGSRSWRRAMVWSVARTSVFSRMPMLTFKHCRLPAVVALSSLLASAGCEDLEREHPELAILATSAVLIAGGALCLDARNSCLENILEEDEDEHEGDYVQQAWRGPRQPMPASTLEGVGEFEPSDVDELCAWAEGGDGPAQSSVGTYHRYGLRPFERNPMLAYKWYTLAMESGHEQARTYRDGLVMEMTEDAVLEGERLAQSWQFGDCLKEVAAASAPE